MSHPIYLVAVAAIMALGAMGVSFSYWTGGLVIEGTARTGYLDPCFTRVEILDENQQQGQTKVDLGGSGKELAFQIDNAGPDYYLHLRYRIENRGTIPLQYETTVSQNPNLHVEIKAPEGQLKPGESGEGEMELRMNSVSENSLYELSSELVFKQVIP